MTGRREHRPTHSIFDTQMVERPSITACPRSDRRATTMHGVGGRETDSAEHCQRPGHLRQELLPTVGSELLERRGRS